MSPNSRKRQRVLMAIWHTAPTLQKYYKTPRAWKHSQKLARHMQRKAYWEMYNDLRNLTDEEKDVRLQKDKHG